MKIMSASTNRSYSIAFAASLIYTIAAFSQCCLAGRLDDESAAADHASSAPKSVRLPDWLMGFNEETYAEGGKNLDLQHALRSVVDPNMPGYCWVYGSPPLDWKVVDRLNPELRDMFTNSFPKVNTIGFSNPNVMALYARYVQDYIIVSTTTDSSLKPIVWREGLPANFNWREKMAEVQKIDPDYRARHSIRSIAEFADRLQDIESISHRFSKEMNDANRLFYEGFKKSLTIEEQENWILSQRYLKDPDDINSYIGALQIFDNPCFTGDRVWLLSVITRFHQRVVSNQKLDSSGLDLLREIHALYTATHGELTSNPLRAELNIFDEPGITLYEHFIKSQSFPSPSSQANEILEGLETADPTFFPNRNLKQFFGRKLTQVLNHSGIKFNKETYDEYILPTYLTLVAGSHWIDKIDSFYAMIAYWDVSKSQETRMEFCSGLAKAIASSLDPGFERIGVFHKFAWGPLPLPKFAWDEEGLSAAANILECTLTSPLECPLTGPSALLPYLAEYLGRPTRQIYYPDPLRVSEIVDQFGKGETNTRRTLLALELVYTPSNVLHDKAIQAAVQLKPSIHYDFFSDIFHYIGFHFKMEHLTPEFVKALEPIVSLDPVGLIVDGKHCIFDALATISDKSQRMQSLETLNILVEKAPRLKSELQLGLPKSQEDYARQIVKVPNLWKLRTNAIIIAKYLAMNGNYLYYDAILKKLTDSEFNEESAIDRFFEEFGQVDYLAKGKFLGN